MTARLLARLAALLLGLFSGAMLAIGAALVPFWRRLPPAEFRLWFEEHAPRIRRLMYPLGASATACALAAAVTARESADPRWARAAALAASGVTGITVAVNEPANQRFVTPGALTDDETTALLERWARWHWVRITLGVLGTFAAVRAVSGES